MAIKNSTVKLNEEDFIIPASNTIDTNTVAGAGLVFVQATSHLAKGTIKQVGKVVSKQLILFAKWIQPK